MSFSACRELSYWEDQDWSALECDDSLLEPHTRRPLKVSLKPVAPYSKRTTILGSMRDGIARARAYADEDRSAPSGAAEESAKHFINKLPDDCLSFEYAIARSGEINFFFGPRGNPDFQLIVDSRGLLSYYGLIGETEFAGDEEVPQQFNAIRLYSLLNAA